MSAEELADLLDRLREVAGEGAEAAPAEHDAAAVGAEGAGGIEIPATGARISVYAFDGWPSGQEVPEAGDPDDEALYRVRGTNGRYLLVGHVRLDGPAGSRAKRPVSRVATAFAGRERAGADR
jgi:hypothetical protein